MKYILGIIATILMIWSMLEKNNPSYKVYVQGVAVALFFYLMMQLMNKTPSKHEESDKQDNNTTNNGEE